VQKLDLPLLLLLAVGCGVPRPSLEVDRTGRVRGSVVLPDGSLLGVHVGVKWGDVNVYLSIDMKLVAVDEAAARTLWSRDLDRDYDRLSILLDEQDPRLELSSTRGAPEVERFRLQTGERVSGPGEDPSGLPVRPLTGWSGRWSKVGRPLVLTASTAANWAAVRAKLFEGVEAAPRVEGIDFGKQLLLVVSDGDGVNCRGIEGEAWDDGARILLRLHHQKDQTFQGADRVRPFGVFALPRTGPRSLVVQWNDQAVLGGPPNWKDLARMALPPDPAVEIRSLAE
jgi:hypothetical protein